MICVLNFENNSFVSECLFEGLFRAAIFSDSFCIKVPNPNSKFHFSVLILNFRSRFKKCSLCTRIFASGQIPNYA